MSNLGNQIPSWHTYSVAKTLKTLKTNPEKGLTSQEVEQRLRIYGANEIKETARRKSWEIFLDQFKNLMLIMLIAVAIISGILDVINLRNHSLQDGFPFKDTIFILIIVILNGVLGYLQESRAEKALAALKSLSSPKVQVLRNRQRQEIDSKILVPGDIVFLESGVQLCADCRIIEASNLQVRESALTGEANPTTKDSEHSGIYPDTPLGDRFNMVFTGTEVIQGTAKVVVTNTGMETELGKIAQMLQTVKNEPTPLQKRMTQLANTLVTGSLILVLLVIVAGIIEAGNFSTLQKLIETSLSMAVAVVPEGLPAVITVTLAIGTQKMVKRQALIRKLPAVETLGSVNTICSDKTGTLTQNKMVVQEVTTMRETFQITGNGYNPEGGFFNQQQELIQPQSYEELELLLVACVLCNNAFLTKDNTAEWIILGDPTEGALLSLAGKANLTHKYLREQFLRVAEIPFSSEGKRMSVILQEKGETIFLMFTKGSPELILERCVYYQLGNQNFHLTETEYNQILEQNNQMAENGLRVLAFAYQYFEHLPTAITSENLEKELIWLGLVGMLDAPRSEVKLAVSECKSAGIRTIMITGDHPLTAKAIAQHLGIAKSEDNLMSGQELEKLSQSELEAHVEHITIYARVAPEHKLRIVQALQKQGKLVAMTGDGVNDAPALKQADIGIAMGITGTDVSKEASDMILLDDNFATIVAATEEGRVVYSNIRRFIRYILGSNVGEVLTIAAAPILGLPNVPLTPLQILWMNLVTDGIPALALAVEAAEPDIMNQPPINPKESIFARGLGFYIIRIGIIFSIITISLMVWAFHNSQNFYYPDSWKTMVFTTLCLGQMGHAIAVRSDTRLTIQLNPFSNPYLLIAVLMTTILQLMLIYVPILRDFFETEFLTFQQLLICLGFSSLIFVWVELEKLFIKFFMTKKSQN